MVFEHPVAVTKISPILAASSMVMKGNRQPSDKVEDTLVLVQRVIDGHGVVSGSLNK